MSKKNIIMLMLLVAVMLININVNATCSTMSGRYPNCTSTCNYTSYSDCTGAKIGSYPCCSWTDPTCTGDTYLSNHACVDKKTCCVKGENKKKNTCGTGERDGGCLEHTISFDKPPKKLSHGKVTSLYAKLPEGVTGWTLNVTSGESYVSKFGHAIRAVNTSGQCQTVTLSATKDDDNTYNYTDGTASIVIYPAWQEEGTKKMSNLTDKCAENYGITEDEADKKGLNVYRINCSGSSGVCKCDVYKRGCGKGSTPSPKCYIDNDGFMRWGVYSYSKTACKDSKGNYIVCSGKENETAVPKKECVNKPVCNTDKPATSKKTTTCNGLGDNHGTYKKYCRVPNVFENGKATTKYFYEIDCNEGIYTEFKGPAYDWSLESSQNAFLYPGTGFKYMLGATSRLYCTGKFYNTMYEKYLKYIKEYRGQLAKLAESDEEKEELMSKKVVSDFSELVAKSYLGWDPDYTFEPKVVLTDLVAKKNNEEPYSVELVRNKATSDIKANTWICGELIKNTKVKLNEETHKLNFGSRGHANFTYDQKQRVEKIVPEACLNPNDGKISYGGTCSEDYSLGAQFFISSNREVIDKMKKNKTPYNYTVEVTDMGFTGTKDEFYASNGTTGRLELLDNQIIYRHVDPKDPFLKGTSHVIGINWKNKKYDFTKIIKPETWNEISMYKTIRLNQKTNQKIKELTKDKKASVYYVLGCKDDNTIICKLVRDAKR
jgi:hypothetical protein